MNGDAGETLRERRLRELFPLVRQIAKRIARIARGADPDDLAGDGALGLIRAVDTFDAARGPSLESYARTLILGAMLNGMRRSDPVSERVRRTMRAAEERRYELAQRRGTLPSLAEMDGDDPRLRRARIDAHRRMPLSLDGPFAGNDPLGDRSRETAREALEAIDRRRLREAIELLPERQRRIIALHYAREFSLRDIGERLAVSPQRVSQLHLRALRTLRRTAPAP